MHEILVGLEVTDDAQYRTYREAMLPILTVYGGGLGYDFRVSEVLISQTDQAINRVFTIRFPDREASERFFADPDYLAAKRDHFEKAVAATTIIASYDNLS